MNNVEDWCGHFVAACLSSTSTLPRLYDIIRQSDWPRPARRSDGATAWRRVRTKAPVPECSRLYADMARYSCRISPMSRRKSIPFRRIAMDRCSRSLIARGCSSRISPRSIDAAKGGHTTRFSIKPPAVRGSISDAEFARLRARLV